MEDYATYYDESGNPLRTEPGTTADLINALRRFGEHDLADDLFRSELIRNA